MKIWKETKEYKIFKGKYGTIIISKNQPMVITYKSTRPKEEKLLEVDD